MAARARFTCGCDAESEHNPENEPVFGIGSSAVKGAIKSQRTVSVTR
jgi:hypothetical protein